MHNENLSPAKLAELTATSVIIDIRRGEEWQATGLIANSHPLTFFHANGSADPEEWLRALAQLATPEDQLVLICRSGQRSRAVLDFLRRATPYQKLAHLSGGILAWQKEALPLSPYLSTNKPANAGF